MKRALALIAALALFVATPARADFYMFTYDYYNDAQFTQWLDFAYTNCLGQCVEGNCSYAGPYRIVEKENCNTGLVVLHYCQAWNGSSYQTTSCPGS
jgi:hypothetical protein